MDRFELAKVIQQLIDGSWAFPNDEKNNLIIRAALEECDSSIDITIGKKRFSVDIKEV